MILKIKHFVTIVTLVLFASCKEGAKSLQQINAKQIAIDSTIQAVDSIDAFVAPYRNRINEVLDSTLAYAPKSITKSDGNYNTSAGNLMADVVLSESQPIFKARTGNEIDIALLNHGGIRSIISEGNVSARTAYEVMPFENTIVVVELSGKSILHMVDYLIKSKRAHPIAGMKLVLDKSDQIKKLTINGKPFNEKRSYFVATSNYLVTGGDNMGFFKDKLQILDTDYLIRNAMIDYFKKVDTLKAVVDDRYMKL